MAEPHRQARFRPHAVGSGAVVSLGDVVAAAAAMPPRYRALVVVMAWGQLRRNEALELRRRDIGDDGLVTVPHAGGPARGRAAYLRPGALELVRWHLDTFVGPEPDARLFPPSGGWSSAAWRRAAQTIGRPYLRLHDIRYAVPPSAADVADVLAALAALGEVDGDGGS